MKKSLRAAVARLIPAICGGWWDGKRVRDCGDQADIPGFCRRCYRLQRLAALEQERFA